MAATLAVFLVDVLSGGLADLQTIDVSASPAVLAVAIPASSVAALPPVSSSLVDGSGLAAHPAGDLAAVLAGIVALL